MQYKLLISSESVGKGHPDKICDQISDCILDQCLKQDAQSRVACEVFASNRLIVIGGEITTKAYVDVVKCAWDILIPLGYNENDFTIISNVNKQSINIAASVDKQDGSIGAGDQGIVFGYATNETESYLPLSIVLANELVKKLEHLRTSKVHSWIKADMKSQVTIDYSDFLNPKIDTMLISVQHDEHVKNETIEKVISQLMDEVATNHHLNLDFKKLINPSGKFVIGGPIGDTGLTGRKIIVDTYGGIARHGGGAFSGKDYTKVDRSGAYFARYIAKNIVASGLSDKCEIQLAFAISKPKPIAFFVETFNTNKVPLEKIYDVINQCFDWSVSEIVEKLDLKNPIYQKTSVYGHFSNPEFKWEQTDYVPKIKQIINQNSK